MCVCVFVDVYAYAYVKVYAYVSAILHSVVGSKGKQVKLRPPNLKPEASGHSPLALQEQLANLKTANLLTVLPCLVPQDTTPMTDPEFNERKMALHPYAPDAAGLPILVADGKVSCQSRAILRCLGCLQFLEAGRDGNRYFFE